MKKQIFIMALAATALIACKEEKKDMDDVMDENAMETETVVEVEEEQPMTRTVSYSQEDAGTMQRDFEESVTVDQDGNVTNIKGWTVYSTVDKDITSLENANTANKMTAVQKLRTDFNSLKNSIPDYLNLRRVRRAVDDVDREISDFEELSTESNVSDRKMNRYLNNIGEAYDDLADEVARARKKYVENKEDAIEEYLEEVNDLDSGKTTEERYRDAREEYDEEMDQK
ncbi:hypothetical protein [Nonlabens sp. Hel1_33_55]|uniref:hypothetical protein n=1 Tax=Nonlabens sp. Hel1_33_55 TaxID=1336802 RepID=UPI000B88BEBF|nr:hypothetical protein [Nonlabens sp. Hel1_33_55]